MMMTEAQRYVVEIPQELRNDLEELCTELTGEPAPYCWPERNKVITKALLQYLDACLDEDGQAPVAAELLNEPRAMIDTWLDPELLKTVQEVAHTHHIHVRRIFVAALQKFIADYWNQKPENEKPYKWQIQARY